MAPLQTTFPPLPNLQGFARARDENFVRRYSKYLSCFSCVHSHYVWRSGESVKYNWRAYSSDYETQNTPPSTELLPHFATFTQRVRHITNIRGNSGFPIRDINSLNHSTGSMSQCTNSPGFGLSDWLGGTSRKLYTLRKFCLPYHRYCKQIETKFA